MNFGELLQNKKDAIAARWCAGCLEIYPSFAAEKFHRQRDRFANPVGHSLREGTAAIVTALLADGEDSAIETHLDEIIRIRAVQQFPPSISLRFVFELKDAARAELADVENRDAVASWLADFDARVDRIALTAFDIFLAFREQVYDLRVAEAKRRVAWVIDHLSGRAGEGEAPEATPVAIAETEGVG